MEAHNATNEAQTQINTLADVAVGDVIRSGRHNEDETVILVKTNAIRTELKDGSERTHVLDKTNEEMHADKGASFKLPGKTDHRHFLTVVETAEKDNTDETATVESAEKTETGTVRFTVSNPQSEYKESYLAEQHDGITGAYKLVVSPGTVGDNLHDQMVQAGKPHGVETIDTA